MAINTLSKRDYSALIFRQLTDADYRGAAPGLDALQKLPKKLLELAFALLSIGTDKADRARRFEAEVLAIPGYGDGFLEEVNAADPNQDPALLGSSTGWNIYGMAKAYEPLPPLEWLAMPYISRPSVSIWFGRPKSLKSMVVLDLALHVAAGKNWMTRPRKELGGVPVTKSGVLWVDLENGERVTQARISALGNTLGVVDEDPFYWVSMPSPWPVMSEAEQVENLVQTIESYNGEIGLIVIDHFGQSLGSYDENGPQMAEVMGNLRTIAERANVAIVLIHHQTKSGGGKGNHYQPQDTIRGHGSILAGVDLAVLVARDETEKDKLLIKPVAARGPDAEALAASWTYEQNDQLDLKEARFWKDDIVTVAEKLEDAILEILAEGEHNQRQLIVRVKELVANVGDSRVRDAISKIEKTGQVIVKRGDKNSKIYYLAGDQKEMEW
jgi:hypothetical protein